MNQLFQQNPPPQQGMPNNIMQMWQQFKSGFQGDENTAKQQIQQMLNSGKLSQQQYTQAVQMANQFSNMFGVRM